MNFAGHIHAVTGGHKRYSASLEYTTAHNASSAMENFSVEPARGFNK